MNLNYDLPQIDEFETDYINERDVLDTEQA